MQSLALIPGLTSAIVPPVDTYPSAWPDVQHQMQQPFDTEWAPASARRTESNRHYTLRMPLSSLI